MLQESYVYKNVPISGGGYVTGIVFDEKDPTGLYARTDIGGTYRMDREKWQWVSMSDHVTMEDLRETYPIAVALDQESTVYIVSGNWREAHAKLSVSKDRGVHFTHYDLPFKAHGNLNGRGTGRHLIVDKKNQNVLYCASQTQGLWKSEDAGANWTHIEAMKEDYLTFVGQSPDGALLIVGTAGVTTCETERKRGKALYVSNDGGASFEPLWQPECPEMPEVIFEGLVAQRYTSDEQYLYVTMQMMGPNATNRELGYSCDNGSVWFGTLIRYEWEELCKGNTDCGTDISPNAKAIFEGAENGSNPMDSGGTFGRKDRIIKERGLQVNSYGLSGVSACAAKPGLLAVATLSRESGDCIFRSLDYGKTWEVILYDLEVGRMDFRTEYMKPEYNGGHNLIHWMTEVVINPFDPNELWFNTGTGPFLTRNLLDETVVFSDWSDGIEETVHINAYSPHAGEVKLIDIVGDLGGFAFRDIDKPCDNSFADADGNRYITCLNADYPDADPNYVIVTARGNWTGMTKGGLIRTKDGCVTFDRIPLPFGITEKLDEQFHLIEKPNVNAGWVAVSAKGERIVWSVADRVFLPVDCIVTSGDGGKTFVQTKVYDLKGVCISDKTVAPALDFLRKRWGVPSGAGSADDEIYYGMKVMSDRVNDDIFYGFGHNGEFYVSRDGGMTFCQKRVEIYRNISTKREQPKYAEKEVADSILGVEFAFVDTMNKTEIRSDNGKSGIFYMALRDKGLFKLKYDAENDIVFVYELTLQSEKAFRLGLGVLHEGADYLREDKALYVVATLDGEYGFYRTCDEGKTYVRLNTAEQMFGEINSCEGDSRTFGLFYLATGSRGIIYGRPE